MAESSLQHERLIRGIAKGAGVVFFGSIIARILGYAIRALIARNYGPEGYGLVSTGLALFTIGSTIALLGFSNALSRQIVYYRNTDRTASIKSLVFSSYGISTLLAVLLGGLLFFNSTALANRVFENQLLIPFVQAFGISIIFSVWLSLSSSIYKAFKRMILYSLFQDAGRFGAILMAIVLAILLQAPVRHLGFYYLLAFACVGIVGTVTIFYLTPLKKYPLQWNFSTTLNLFRFSWPLMIASIVYLMLFKVDILMIGSFLNQSEVGLYNAALPIGQLLLIILSSFTPFLLPTMTEYYSKQDIPNLDTTFSVSTKWIYLLTIPVFSALFFFPEFFLVVLFGEPFRSAAPVLRVVSVGFLFASSVGPTGNLLTVVGRTRLQMLNTVATFIINVILNIVLIQAYGIIGAACASAISLVFLNGITLIEIYILLKVQPYSRAFLPITGLALGLAYIASLLLTLRGLWSGLLVLAIYAAVYFGSLFLFKVFDDNDRIIFREVKKRLPLSG